MKVKWYRGISGWNNKIYFHAMTFSYPSGPRFQIRIYNRIEKHVIFERTWK